MSKPILDKWFDHSVEAEGKVFGTFGKNWVLSVGWEWPGEKLCRFYSKNKDAFNMGSQGIWSCWDREWGQQVILQILRAVEREEEVTREMKIILTFFLVQKIDWASGPKRAFYLGHRILLMGKAILISWAGQEFSNSMEDSVLSSRCRINLRSTKHMEVVVGGMSKKRVRPGSSHCSHLWS